LPGNCPPPPDAVAVQEDPFGNKVPLTDKNGASLTDTAVLARLSERRATLDSREQDLNMRSALVDAAEKRLEERTAALKSLESQVTDLNNQKKAAAQSQFTALVSMYETMKPADAAAIFNNLDMAVLAKVAKAISPRKMAPILAKMTAARAQELTVRLAGDDTQTATAGQAGNFGALPQIVGQ
jgi:flagellar motility protein MotE (MotC chaperone)